MTVTAVDTNVFLDIWLDDPDFAEQSQNAIDACLTEGSLVVSPVVIAELVAHALGEERVRSLMDALNVEVAPIVREEATAAGALWGQRRGQPRRRFLPDYLIAAGAARTADRLLTRDAGFTRLDMPGLVVVSPEEVVRRRS